MEILQSIILPILSSAIVAGIISLVVKLRFNKKLEEYEMQLKVSTESTLEEIKLDLKNAGELSQETARKRREACYEISRYLNKIMNITRDMVQSDPIDIYRIEEYESVFTGLQNCFYKYKLCLEETIVWDLMGRYRTPYTQMQGCLSLIGRCRKNGNLEQEIRVAESARKLYGELEEEYEILRFTLAAFVSSNSANIVEITAGRKQVPAVRIPAPPLGPRRS
jgi:hypothetical protein